MGAMWLAHMAGTLRMLWGCMQHLEVLLLAIGKECSQGSQNC